MRWMLSDYNVYRFVLSFLYIGLCAVNDDRKCDFTYTKTYNGHNNIGACI